MSSFARLITLQGRSFDESRHTVMPEGHHMTTPEQELLRATRRRRQIMDDETMDRLELDTPQREDAWVKDFIGRLVGVVRNIGN
jgi:hypothetical protein